jgi:hypothetical protein
MMANQNNNYPMKEWHFEHMQKTILKYEKIKDAGHVVMDRSTHKYLI